MGYPNKQTTREACIKRYGPIDFGSKYWASQSSWIRMLELPHDWFPSWKVLDTSMVVQHIACNSDIHAPLLAALKSVKDKGLGPLLHTFDGCFNIRMVRGSNDHFSAHSYGLALDINAGTNQLSAASGGFYDHADFVKCFTDQGFAWGGNFHGRKDPMHFSYSWEG